MTSIPAVRDASGDLRLASATLSGRGWLTDQPDDLRAEILRSIRIRRIPRGGAVYRCGDAADGLYGVVNGRVKFRTCTPDGREIVAGAVGPGGWFGEVSVFDGLPRIQDAIVLSSTMVAVFSIDRFREVTEANPRYLRNFAGMMARNIRGLSFFSFEISSAPPPERILRLLGFLLHEEMRQGDDSAIILDVGQDLLAAIAGLSRQTVNRELSKLATAGAVECRYGRVIVNAELLRRVALSADPMSLLPTSP